MTYSASLATDVGKVRALIGDFVVDDSAHFTDEAIEVYLAVEDNDLRLAAATALDAWAAQLAAEAHTVTLDDYSESTATAAIQMVQHAKALRETARTTPAFAIAAMHQGPDSFPWQDVIINRALRGEL